MKTSILGRSTSSAMTRLEQVRRPLAVSTACLLLASVCSASDPMPLRWELKLQEGAIARMQEVPGQPGRQRIDIGARTSGPSWHIQATVQSFQLVVGQGYRLQFSARADAPRPLSLGLNGGEPDRKNAGLYQTVSITPQWKTITLNFNAETSSDQAQLHFDINEAEPSLEIGDISLSTSTSPSTPTASPPSNPPANLGPWTIANHGDADSTLIPLPNQKEGVRVEIRHQGSEPWHVRCFRAPMAVREGKTYEIRFRARADRPRPLRVELQQQKEPWNVAGSSPILEISTEWQEMQSTLLATLSDDEVAVNFHLGQESVPIELTDLAVVANASTDTPPPQAEAIPLPPWTLANQNNATSTMTPLPEDKDGVRIADIHVGKEPWHVKILRIGLRVEKDRSYRVSFDARSDQPRPIYVEIQQSREPWSVLGLSRTFDVTGDWQPFHADFQASQSDESAGVNIHLGQVSTPVEIAHFAIQPSDPMSTPSPTPAPSTENVATPETSLPDMPHNPWLLATTAGSVGELFLRSEESHTVRVAIARVTNPSPDSVQLLRLASAPMEGRKCRLRLRGRADGPKRVTISLVDGRGRPLGLQEETNLQTEWQDFDREFVSPHASESAWLSILVGSDDTDVEIADVGLTCDSQDLLRGP